MIELTAIRVAPYHMEIRPAPAQRAWISEHVRFSRNCLPMMMANQAGWEVLNPIRFTATWSGGDDRPAIRLVSAEPIPYLSSHFGFGVLTWHLPYLMRTSPGWNLLVRGPANRPKDGISALEGLVETDWSTATFTMNWRFTRAGIPITFEAGEPFAFLVPQRRSELEEVRPTKIDGETEPKVAARFRHWRDSRAEFNLRLRCATETSHQLHYLRGQHIDGERAPEHQTRLLLAPFEEVS